MTSRTTQLMQPRGALVFDRGTQAGTGTLCSIVPATGQKFIFGGAKIAANVATAQTDVINEVIAEIRNNGTAVDDLGISYHLTTSGSGGSGGGGSPTSDRSELNGDCLVGDGSDAYTIEVTVATGVSAVKGILWGWLV